MITDFDAAYRAVETRDSRFDGQFFTAVRTTKIYCRPGCPARTPHRRNVEFYPTSAAAQSAGYRACKRCLPEAAPGSPEWNLRADAVGAAMRLIGDGVVDREGVPGLARRLGYTPRHLGRMLQAEVGAGPLALARARRAHTARLLLVSTTMPVSDIAFAAGFSSIRQFNETIRDVFDLDPTSLRAVANAGGRALHSPAGSIQLRLPVREPFAADALLDFLAARAVPGVEQVSGNQYTRSLRLPSGAGLMRLTFPAATPSRSEAITATVGIDLMLQHLSDLAPAVDRCRRLLDADADPVGIDAALRTDPALAGSVQARAGLRLPGAVDGAEIVFRALVGQQISVAAARTTLGRLATICGEPLPFKGFGDSDVTMLFPAPAAIAALDPSDIGGPRRRAATIIGTAAALADGELVVDPGRTTAELTADLVARPGIGPWTAGYVAMRVLGDPDVLLTGDLALRAGAAALGLPADARELDRHGARWRPFRSYAGMHLWAAAGAQPTSSVRASAPRAGTHEATAASRRSSSPRPRTSAPSQEGTPS